MGDKIAARETFLKYADAADRTNVKNGGKFAEWDHIVFKTARSLNEYEAADIFKRYEHEIKISKTLSDFAARATV